MKIKVNPHNVEIVKEQTEPINEREIKVSKCEFEFDEVITDDFVKEAYFTLNGSTYKQIIENNECDYPSEVLAEKGTLEIGVVAFKVENDEEIVRYNPSPDYFESWVGSLKDAENSEPITPSEMEQFEQELQNGLNDIEDAIERAERLDVDAEKVEHTTTVTITKQDGTTKSVEILDGEKGDKGDKGEKGDPGDLDSTAIVDNLTTNRADKVLSAKQGKVLKDLVDANKIVSDHGIINLNSALDLKANTADVASEYATKESVNDNISSLDAKVNSLASGSPLVASSTSGMTDTSRIYVNTTDGKWYYYDGDSWEIGGTYQATSESDTIKILQNNMNYYGTTIDFVLTGSSVTSKVWLEAGKTYLITKLAPSDSITGTLFIEGYASNNISIPNIEVMRFFTPTNSGYLRFYNTNSVSGTTLSIRIYGLVDKLEDYIYGYDVTNTDITGLYVKQNDIIKVDVASNTVQTLMFIDPYGAESTYLTIPVGAGKYTYRADKNGYIRFQNSETSINAKIYVMSGIITQLDNNKVYIVDKNGNGDYTSFTEMLADLQNDTTEKTVYVNNGTYDIYEELGGDDFIATITDPANINWRDVNYCVPKNTHIIGLGNVLLKFAPTAEQIGSNEMAFLFSPLNISDTCTIENISVFGTNCRYAIHDESSGNNRYDNTIHKYINVTAEKQHGTYGNAQVFGSGLARNCYWEFDGCTFKSDRAGIWTVHTTTSQATDVSKIFFNNCIFANYDESSFRNTDTIQFISGIAESHLSVKNIVNMNNCYVTGKIGLTGDAGATQRYKLTTLKNTSNGIRIDENLASNPYIPEVYN